MCVILINILINVYSGLDGKGEIPRWLIFLTPILYITYYMLDIIDGKQARRTKTSSPLGLLMDHGCDSLVTFLFSMSMASIFKCEGAIWFCFAHLITVTTFFFCTWEEYCLDSLDLPFFNGVNEGCVVSNALIFFTACVGQNFWLTEITINGIKLNYSNLLVGGTWLFSNVYPMSSIIKVLRSDKTKSVVQALLDSTIYWLLTAALFVLVLFSDSRLVEKSPKLIFYMFGFCHSKIVGNIQIAHLAKTTFKRFSKPSLFFIISIIFVSLNGSKYGFSIDSSVIFFLIFNFITWLHYAYYVTEELCECLDIYAFTIKNKLM